MTLFELTNNPSNAALFDCEAGIAFALTEARLMHIAYGIEILGEGLRASDERQDERLAKFGGKFHNGITYNEMDQLADAAVSKLAERMIRILGFSLLDYKEREGDNDVRSKEIMEGYEALHLNEIAEIAGERDIHLKRTTSQALADMIFRYKLVQPVIRQMENMNKSLMDMFDSVLDHLSETVDKARPELNLTPGVKLGSASIDEIATIIRAHTN